jgi:hypothetical protein
LCFVLIAALPRANAETDSSATADTSAPAAAATADSASTPTTTPAQASTPSDSEKEKLESDKKPDVQSDVKADAEAPKADVKPDPKEGAKSDGKTDAKSDAKTETKAGSESPADSTNRKTGIGKLATKLTNKDGQQASIGVLTPMDYTTLNYGDRVQSLAIESFSRYGSFKIKKVADQLSALTLEEFRRVVTHYDLDIALVVVLKPTNFDVFLFDRRTPYNVYAHSEVLPESVQYQVTPAVVEEYTKAIVRRVLYSYIQDQYYELPREEVKPFLESEIPMWVASAQAYHLVNNEILSRFYFSVSVGAVLSGGTDGSWTSNLVALQFGIRVMDNIYIEPAAMLFAYNLFQVSLKYLITQKDSPFRFSLGLGAGLVSNAHTLNWDQHYTQGLNATYIIPSAAFMFPIVDIHFKVETQAMLGGGGKWGLSILPGIYFIF